MNSPKPEHLNVGAETVGVSRHTTHRCRFKLERSRNAKPTWKQEVSRNNHWWLAGSAPGGIVVWVLLGLHSIDGASASAICGLHGDERGVESALARSYRWKIGEYGGAEETEG